MEKILYLIDHHIDTIGGSQKSTKTIIFEMIKEKNEVGLFMSDGNKKEPIKNCSLSEKCYLYAMPERNKKTKIGYTFCKLSHLRKCINEFKPSIVHAQNPSAGIAIAILKRFHLIDSRIKCIFTDRGFFTEYSKMLQFIFKRVRNYWDCVITTTERNMNEWKKYTNVKNIYCVSNVLDYDWFEYSPKIEKELREKYNVPSTFNVGFSGRFVEFKRWDTVMDICRLIANVDNVKVVVALASAPEEGKSLESEEKYLKELKQILGDKLLLFRNLNLEQMKEFYYIIDAFVLTSIHESFGRTLLEAMTKNCLVFGTNSGGVPNVINNSNYLFEVGDCKTITELLKKFAVDHDKTNREKEMFLKYVDENFKPNVMQKNLSDVYSKIK